MAFSRTAALRSCFRGARPTIARPQLLRQVARRGYASGGHEAPKSGGDALWAAGAVAVTIPSCWWILSNGSDTSHGHDGHAGHDKAHGAEHKEEPKEESEESAKPEETAESGEIEDASVKSDESDNSSEKGSDTPETSDDATEDTSEVEGADNKTKQPITKDEAASDKAPASNSTSDQNTQSGEQEGLTNTETKSTSVDIVNDSNKSKKDEGATDAA